MFQSLHDGLAEALPSVSTFADGIAVTRPGDHAYDLCRQCVDDIVTVTHDEISTAILTLIEQHKLIAEGAGAVSVAAAMFNKVPIQGKKTICLVSGGNIDVTILSRVITRGLLKAGRSLDITLALSDRPGQLSLVSDIIAKHGGNVVSVYHDRSDLNMQVTDCFLRLSLETRDHAHAEEIIQALSDAGLQIIKS